MQKGSDDLYNRLFIVAINVESKDPAELNDNAVFNAVKERLNTYECVVIRVASVGGIDEDDS